MLIKGRREFNKKSKFIKFAKKYYNRYMLSEEIETSTFVYE